ncbi:unnamed protein product [Rhizopus microsporus]
MRQIIVTFILLLSFMYTDAMWIPGSHARKMLTVMLDSTFKNDTKLPEKYGPFYFDQPVDHFSKNSSTFKHRYWANTEWYHPGGPVIIYNAGETAADERSFYVTNSSMAELAKRLQGIIVVMEHRFYGLSLPNSELTAKTLETLTTAQALEDIASFIRELKIPNFDIDLPPAPETKYIVYGGSYSGNLAAWMRLKYPDIVFAAVPSSAPVEMRFNYYDYFEPIRKYGPKHCVEAIQSVVLFIDHILFSPFEKAKINLKRRFGAEDLKHDDDFAELLSSPLGLWQAMTPESNPFEEKFCSIFEGRSTLQEYVDAYGGYIKHLIKRSCDEEDVNQCFDSHDPRSTFYADIAPDSKAWMWQICTEYAYWQTASPIWRPTLVSRKLNANWYQRQCPLLFGEHAVPRLPQWHQINQEYKGWHISLDRVYWLDGEWDPWRTLSVQSDDAPDRSSWEEDAYYTVLPKSVHHWVNKRYACVCVCKTKYLS